MTTNQFKQLFTKVQNKTATKEEQLELLQAINASLRQYNSLLRELNESIKQDKAPVELQSVAPE